MDNNMNKMDEMYVDRWWKYGQIHDPIVKFVKLPMNEDGTLLVDKYTQVNSSEISIVHVDLEQINYKIQPTFLDQMEMQVNR